MLKIVASAAAVLAVAVAAVLVYAATKPDTFRVQRSATIQAPPDKVFALIADLRGWGACRPTRRKIRR